MIARLKAGVAPTSWLILLSLTVLAQAQAQNPTPPVSNQPSQTTNATAAPQLAQTLGNYAVKIPSAINDNPDEKKPEGKNAGKNNESAESAGGNSPGAPTPVPPQPGLGSIGKTISRERNAPVRESATAIPLGSKYFNALLNGLAQGAGFVFGVEATTADAIPGIEFRARALASTRLYYRFEGEAFFPKVGSENTHASIWYNYTKRTRDRFFGLGPRTPETPETNYGTIARAFNVSIFHDFAKGVQAGVYARISNTSAFRGDNDNDIPVDALFSGNPAVIPMTRFVPGLNTNAKLYSYGAFAEIDKRDNERGLTKGGYLYGRVASFQGIKNGNAFSDFGWNELELDGRAYVPLFSDSTSLALRIAGEFRNPKGGSQIPFYEQAWLGGHGHGRGFRNYRFRGNNLLLFTAEPRQTIWKQDENKGLDAFIFGDFGQVWGDNRSPFNPLIRANDRFASQNWRTGFGGGVQYRWSKSVAGRLEFGHSNERNLIYFSISRGF